MDEKDKGDLEKLNEAIQAFAQAQSDDDKSFVVSNALLVWEQTTFDGEDVMHRFRYTIPTESSMSNALGLVVAADAMLADDLLTDTED